MGGAYAASALDASAAYWNPAGLAFLKSTQISSSFEDLYGLGLLRYTTLGAARPGLGGGTASFRLLRLQTVGEASFFTYAENTYVFSYGRKVGRPFAAGASVKFYSAATDQKGTGLGYDAGLLYRTAGDRFRLGVTAHDVNEPRVRWGTGAVDILPPGVRLGSLLKLGPVSEFTLEEDWRRREKQVWRAGMAHHLVNRTFVLRAGAHRAARQGRWNVSAGGGLRLGRFDFDYAWDQDEDLGNTQTLGAALRFGR